MTQRQGALPPGTRLVHIGPHKTGTTTLQGAFHRSRRALAAHGVRYAGASRQPAHAAAAIAGGTPVHSLEAPSMAHWEKLCAEVAGAGRRRRVVVSSERFANADAGAARAVVDGLGGERVHVVVTLRPLVKILPSQWQEYIKSGHQHTYEKWLDGMLRRPPYRKPTPSFWRRHRHDELVARWADTVGADRLTVVVVDQAEPLAHLRAFEVLLGLPDGVLEPEQDGFTNRSLTAGEVEVLRLVNRELARAERPAPERKLVREALVRSLRGAHVPTDPAERIATPAWARRAAAEVSAEMVAGIRKSGVRVVGDLDTLVPEPAAGDPAGSAGSAGSGDSAAAEPSLPVGAAYAAVTGALLAAAEAP
ncbi:hypothetical protein [Streptomyces sp. CMB-StM0423]|uniref:hypothetical protein n=1 Tax=Streptomyces sp. CMB-StM0423 TaxID=2059884 RepID=UPI000C70B23F|nr:hypothetical protein [Streptomyces sp. CMB-StM0423]AUH40379.1 hypothetical protein CXR04_09050 [Streptomyces sp. CMB-StM0423]